MKRTKFLACCLLTVGLCASTFVSKKTVRTGAADRKKQVGALCETLMHETCFLVQEITAMQEKLLTLMRTLVDSDKEVVVNGASGSELDTLLEELNHMHEGVIALQRVCDRVYVPVERAVQHKKSATS